MKKTVTRLTIRKMRGHLAQLVGMALLVLVGSAFFVTLYTIYLSYDGNASAFFKSQGYADVTFYGSFDAGDVREAAQAEGVREARGRAVRDFRDGDITLRAVALTGGINAPYLYEGTFPSEAGECALIKKHAEARGIKVGDTLTVSGRSLRVTGIAASPEYVYLVQNERALMADGESFGVLFVMADFFETGYNEIVAAGELPKDAAESLGEKIGALRTVMQDDQLNKVLFKADLDQIRTFAFVFPLIFALLIVMIIYVMIKRAIAMERRQTGIYKALGVQSGRLVFIYIAQFALTALVGAVLGCVAAALICDTIIGLFSVMFEVPGLAFVFYPALWLTVIAVCAAVSAVSALLGVRGVLKPMPAELMRAGLPSGGRRTAEAKDGFLWKRLSFNTRYALKSALRNKGRFLAVLLGMCASCALLTFALGFFNSAEHTRASYFDEFAQYDALIEVPLMPMKAEHPVEESLDEVSKALAVPVTINGGEYRLYVVEDDFDMQRIDTDHIEDGVLLPEYYARQWDVGAGDPLKIDDTAVTVGAVSAQSFSLSLYTSYEYAAKMIPGFMPAYNVIFARDADTGALRDLSRDLGFEYSTLEDDRESFASLMESLDTLIWFMLACAVILGLTVLYTVGLMNLSAREYEYMFMGVMGYPTRSIMLAHVKETALQLVPALAAGFALGYVILNAVKTAFSGDSFVLSAAIFPESYAIAGAAVLVMAGFIALLSARHISRLDIVEGLKSRDE
jgi:putative ABC transport system permease protein